MVVDTILEENYMRSSMTNEEYSGRRLLKNSYSQVDSSAHLLLVTVYWQYGASCYYCLWVIVQASAVDTITEEKILSLLNENLKEETLVWVAHRKSTLKYCDTLLNLRCDLVKILVRQRNN